MSPFSASQNLISAERRVSDIIRDSHHGVAWRPGVYNKYQCAMLFSSKECLWGIMLPHLGSGSANVEKIPECSGNFQAGSLPAVALK